MEARTQGVGEASPVRRVRTALEDRTGHQEQQFCHRARVRRDVGVLLERIEALRICFPDQPDLLDRVLLSGHVIRLLEEARGQPVSPVEVGLVP